jgi:hypothetical protein
MRIVVEQGSSVAVSKAAMVQPPYLRGVPAPFGRQVSTLHALPVPKPVVGENLRLVARLIHCREGRKPACAPVSKAPNGIPGRFRLTCKSENRAAGNTNNQEFVNRVKGA